MQWTVKVSCNCRQLVRSCNPLTLNDNILRCKDASNTHNLNHPTVVLEQQFDIHTTRQLQHSSDSVMSQIYQTENPTFPFRIFYFCFWICFPLGHRNSLTLSQICNLKASCGNTHIDFCLAVSTGSLSTSAHQNTHRFVSSCQHWFSLYAHQNWCKAAPSYILCTDKGPPFPIFFPLN